MLKTIKKSLLKSTWTECVKEKIENIIKIGPHYVELYVGKISIRCRFFNAWGTKRANPLLVRRGMETSVHIIFGPSFQIKKLFETGVLYMFEVRFVTTVFLEQASGMFSDVSFHIKHFLENGEKYFSDDSFRNG